jgi:MFS family permease
VVETHLIPFAQMCGFSTLASTGAYSLFALFNLIGMVVSGLLADKIDRRFLLVSIYVVRSAAFFIPVFVGDDYAILLVFATIAGLALYGTFPPTIGLCAAHFGKENLGFVMGVLTVGHSIGAALGAWFGGFVYDAFLRYDIMWFGAAVLAFISAAFALLASDPRSDGGMRPASLQCLPQ